VAFFYLFHAGMNFDQLRPGRFELFPISGAIPEFDHPQNSVISTIFVQIFTGAM
jgi:hypothetical protein